MPEIMSKEAEKKLEERFQQRLKEYQKRRNRAFIVSIIMYVFAAILWGVLEVIKENNETLNKFFNQNPTLFYIGFSLLIVAATINFIIPIIRGYDY